MQRDAKREILAFLILGGSAFLFLSLLSLHQEDFLIGDKVRNACGPIGAFVSHHLVAWVGGWGAYILAAAVAAWGLSLLARRVIDGAVWKAVGLGILVLTVASLEVAITDGSGSLEALPGGYLGQFFYSLLLARLNRLGAYLLLFTAVAVAILISTEMQLYPVLAGAGRLAADGKLWSAAGSRVRRGMGMLRAVRIPKVRWAGFRLPRFRSGGAAAAADRPFRPPLERRPGVPGAAAVSAAPAATPAAAAAAPAPADRVLDDAEEAEEAEAAGDAAAAGAPSDLDLEAAEEEAPVAFGGGAGAGGNAGARPAAARARPAARKGKAYKLPDIDLLLPPNTAVDPLDRTIVQDTAAKIEETLRHFRIESQVVEVQRGPVITQYEVSLAAGIKVHKIVSLSDDLAMALKARSIRIVAPIPGKSTVGVEVPNRLRATVGLREILESREFRGSTHRLALALGKDIAGAPIVGDLGEMPHLLIAGSTGSGKSVCINSIIINILMTKSPDEVKLILLDPKMVELSAFEKIPHLLTPVVTDMKKAPAVLNWLVEKMDERYELLAMAGVRHLTSYNELGRQSLRKRLEGKVEEEGLDEIPEFIPYYVVIIDELADLMMSASKEVEGSITRLSQKSRAVGIHVILATQRPSVDVITGLIKANMPCRVSFHVTSKVDSRTILDRNGADKLLGKGDMLLLPPGSSNLIRAQGTFISDKEIHDVVEFVRHEAEPQFDSELSRFGLDGAAGGSDEDELYEQAVRIVLESQRGSVTLLQRQLQIGYTRASRLMEIMAGNGLVGPFKGSKAREVYYTLDEWEAARNASKPEEGE